MGQKVGRNDPCPCGSGLKYKHCHDGADGPSAEEPASSQLRWLILVILLVGGAVIAIRGLVADAGSGPKRVWSKEHGHWHVEGEEHE